MIRWMGTRAISPPDNEHNDESMAEAEAPVSDEVPDDDYDGDGEEASEEGDELGLEEMKHKKAIHLIRSLLKNC
jgi:hypothetical protein